MRFRAVIFDLDGTLLDSLAGIADTMNILLEREGYPSHPLAAYRYFVGSGIDEMVSRALPEVLDRPKDINQWVREYREIYHDIWPQKSRPYAGIPELLDQLKVRNIKTAVLSNKSDAFTRAMTAKLLPGHDFAVILGGRPGVPHKPDPGSALEIARRMGIAPREFVFLGDSGIDMETAKNAGMYPVGALWGFRTAEELLDQGAEELIKLPMELLNIINQNE